MRKALLFVAAFFCAACSNYSANLPSIKPYKMDIQQGNYVTSKMMMQLRPDMTKSQVRFIMGTPLIQDGFHPDRWDYFYQMRKGGKIIEQRRVIMEFENDQLKRVRGDVIPAGADPSVPESQPSKSDKSEDKGLLDRLKFWKDDEEVTKPQAAPQELVKPESEPAAPAAAAPAAKPQQAPVEEAAPAPREAPAPSESAPVEPAPAAEPAPADAAEPQTPVESAPAPAPAPAPEPEPAAPASEAQPATVPPPAKSGKAAQPKPESQSAEPGLEDDLPPEDAPGYFERMLEKIGF